MCVSLIRRCSRRWFFCFECFCVFGKPRGLQVLWVGCGSALLCRDAFWAPSVAWGGAWCWIRRWSFDCWNAFDTFSDGIPGSLARPQAWSVSGDSAASIWSLLPSAMASQDPAHLLNLRIPIRCLGLAQLPSLLLFFGLLCHQGT